MTDEIETYERNGLTVTIYPDNDPESPREWDNFGTMFCSHRRYNLGDEQFNPDEFDGWEEVEKYLTDNRGAVVILPLGLYDHSGITMYVGDKHDRWDGGQVGLIYATKEDMDRADLTDLAEVEKYLRQEVEEYDQYLRGDVYGFTITDDNGIAIEDGSLWGIYGLDYCQEEANRVADAYTPPRSVTAKPAGAYHL